MSKDSFFPLRVTSGDQVWPEDAGSLLEDPHPPVLVRAVGLEGAGVC